MKLALKLFAAISAIVVTLFFWNFASVSYPVIVHLSKDSRNSKITLWAYHRYGFVSGALVIDLRSIEDKASAVDVLRVLFQSAERLKDVKFDQVVLAHKGSAKLMMNGEHFQKIGQEFSSQNPIYTMRTLPENIYKLDGTAAYGTWTGGLLGVVGKQMEDLRQFSQDWYLRDLVQDERR